MVAGKRRELGDCGEDEARFYLQLWVRKAQ